MQKVLQELAEAIGYGDAIAVCRRWGGRELRVPVKVAAADPLALVLGLETARKLVAKFGDQRLQLPSERNALLDMRNAAIWKACVIDGQSQESVGLEYGITRPCVSMLLRKMRSMGFAPDGETG